MHIVAAISFLLSTVVGSNLPSPAAQTAQFACPAVSYCTPPSLCQSNKIFFDRTQFPSAAPSFACGTASQSVGYVCCRDAPQGFTPTTDAWIFGKSSSVSAIPWPGFDAAPKQSFFIPSTGGSEKILSEDHVVATSEKAADLASWPCGIPLVESPSTNVITALPPPIQQGEYPWQAAILTNTLQFVCGATIVSEKLVVTLGDCVRNLAVSQLLVRIGDVDLASKSEPLPAYDVLVQTVFFEHGYIARTNLEELAALVLTQSISSVPHARPACLPSFGVRSSDVQPDVFSSDLSDCKLANWGYAAPLEQNTRDAFSYRLLGGRHYVLSRDTCLVVHGNNSAVPVGQECAAGYFGTAICRGGEGSGLVCRAGNRYVLEGIVTSSERCSRNLPVPFIKVARHASFIKVLVDNLPSGGVLIPNGQNIYGPLAPSSTRTRPPGQLTSTVTQVTVSTFTVSSLFTPVTFPSATTPTQVPGQSTSSLVSGHAGYSYASGSFQPFPGNDKNIPTGSFSAPSGYVDAINIPSGVQRPSSGANQFDLRDGIAQFGPEQNQISFSNPNFGGQYGQPASIGSFLVSDELTGNERLPTFTIPISSDPYWNKRRYVQAPGIVPLPYPRRQIDLRSFYLPPQSPPLPPVYPYYPYTPQVPSNFIGVPHHRGYLPPNNDPRIRASVDAASSKVSNPPPGPSTPTEEQCSGSICFGLPAADSPASTDLTKNSSRLSKTGSVASSDQLQKIYQILSRP